MSKHIGIIIRSLKPGGAEKQSALLASVLAEHYKVDLFIQYNEISASNNALLSNPNIELIQLQGNLYKKTKTLRSTINSKGISHLFAYLSSDNLIASLASAGIKHCVVYGGVRSSLLPKHKFMILLLLHRYMQNGTIFNNYNGMEKFVKKGFSKNKSHVIPNGITINQALNTNTSANNTINIISVGRFVDAKDYPAAIKSISILKQNTPTHFKYYIIGFGELENNIRELISNYQLEDCIEVVINPDNMSHYYQMADIYLCTSSFEGLSNSIMEAINYKLPVIATNVGDNECLVLNNKSGLITKVNDTVSISKAIHKLINNPQLRIEFGKNGFTHLEQQYSLEQFANKYKYLIEN